MELSIVRFNYRRCLAPALLWVLSGAAPGQEGDFAQTVDVQLVEVDVIVTDERGRPVTDLAVADFELRVDGASQRILSFSAPAVRSVPRTAAGRQRPAYVALFFDSTNIEVLQRNAIIQEIRLFLTAPSEAELSILVAAADSSRFRVYQPFTHDREAVVEALDQVAGTLAQDQRIAEHQAIYRELQRLSSAVQDFSGRGIAPQVQGLVGRIQAFSDQARNDAMRSAGYLWRLTDSMAGLPGRRVIVYVGGVLSLNPGATLYAALRDVLGSRTGPEAQETGARMPAGMATQGPQSLPHLADHVGSNGVALYAITDPGRRGALWGGAAVGSMEAAPGDAPDPQDVWSPGVGFRSRSEATETVSVLSRATGGLARTGTKNTRPLLAQLEQDLGSSYLLTFQPQHGLDGQSREIEVRARGKGLQVRYRDHYRALSWDQETARSIRAALHHTTAPHELGSDAFDFEIERGQITRTATDSSVLPITLRIALSNLSVVSMGTEHRGQITLFYTAGGPALAAQPLRKVVLPITIPNDRLHEAIGESFDYRIDVELPPGSDRAIVGVRDDIDNRLTTNRILFDDDVR